MFIISVWNNIKKPVNLYRTLISIQMKWLEVNFVILTSAEIFDDKVNQEKEKAISVRYAYDFVGWIGTK
jgi:hypothetical protein